MFDAVILAGGRAERLGGVDKPGLEVGGTPMVGNVAAAARDAGRVIVVGPARDDLPGAVFVREDPPGAGPVPALRAGLGEVTAAWVALLAGDLPFLTAAHISALLEAAGTGRKGAVAVDGEGREQWLLGVWEAAALREALETYAGRSLRGVLGPLVGRRLPLPRRAWFDCDTEDDLEEARNERAG